MSIQIKAPGIKTEPDRKVAIPSSLAGKPVNGLPEKDPAAKPNPKKTRADFRAEEFVRALEQHGAFCIWRKALLCPCHDLDTQQADPNCARCDGSGFFYVDPILVRALVLSVDKDTKLYERMGTWVTGQASITVEPQYRLGYRDSLELRDAVMVFDEFITKGNRRGIRAKLPQGSDMARYRVQNMVHALHQTATNELVELRVGTHFELDANGWIVWTKAGHAAVPNGGVVSLRYEFKPTYVVESYPHAMRNDVSGRKAGKLPTVIALPLQAVGRLDYLTSVTSTSNPLPTTW